jgi:hypothetical protein
MFIPLHPFLPYRVRMVLFWTVGLFWFLLFAYGTFKLLLAREWGSAMFCGGVTLVYLFFAIQVLRTWRAARAREQGSAMAGPRPIE